MEISFPDSTKLNRLPETGSHPWPVMIPLSYGVRTLNYIPQKAAAVNLKLDRFRRKEGTVQLKPETGIRKSETGSQEPGFRASEFGAQPSGILIRKTKRVSES